MRATLSGSACSAASRHSLRAFWSRCRSASSAPLTTADTDGALPASTRRSAYAARCGSIVTVTRVFRSLIPGSYCRGARPAGRHSAVRAPDLAGSSADIMGRGLVRRPAHDVIQHRPAAEQHGRPVVLVVQAEPPVPGRRDGTAGAGALPEPGPPALPVLAVPFGPLAVQVSRPGR